MDMPRLKPSRFSRFFLWLFRRSTSRVIHNVRVAVAASKPEATEILNKIEAALDLVLYHDARAMRVLQTQADGIFVWGTAGAYAEWHRNEKLVVLQPEYVFDPATSTIRLASTLVHETTHAWLETLGFRYLPDRRHRIESICFERELRFVLRAGGGTELISELKEQLARDPGYLSSEAFRERTLIEIERLGVSRQVVIAIEQFVKWCRRLTRRLKVLRKKFALCLLLSSTGLTAWR